MEIFETNSLGQIAKYFQTDEKFVTAKEFGEFWDSCTEEEKGYYRTVDLKTGRRRTLELGVNKFIGAATRDQGVRSL